MGCKLESFWLCTNLIGIQEKLDLLQLRLMDVLVHWDFWLPREENPSQVVPQWYRFFREYESLLLVIDHSLKSTPIGDSLTLWLSYIDLLIETSTKTWKPLIFCHPFGPEYGFLEIIWIGMHHIYLQEHSDHQILECWMVILILLEMLVLRRLGSLDEFLSQTIMDLCWWMMDISSNDVLSFVDAEVKLTTKSVVYCLNVQNYSHNYNHYF